MSARLVGACCLAVIVGACSSGNSTNGGPTTPNVVPKGSRLIGLDLTSAELETYDDSMSFAQTLGADEVDLFLTWTAIEIGPGVFDSTTLDTMEAYYPAIGMPVGLTIAPVNTVRRETPPDLDAVELDDPILLARFSNFLAHIASRLPTLAIPTINIGSETDVYLGTDPTAWQAYENFIVAVIPMIQTHFPNTEIAVELTFDGLTGPAAAMAQSVNQHADIIGISYYPITNGIVRPNSGLGPDFDLILSRYPTKDLLFYQFGCPSDPLNGSSEAFQSEFIRETFNVWDARANRIRMIDFTWSTDLDPALVAGVGTYYGSTDQVFLAFLGSLGLRQFAGLGTDKLAWAELVAQASARGW